MTILYVYLEEDSGFVEPVWYGSIDTSYKEEVESVLNTKYIVLSSGSVEAVGVKATHMEVFM